MASTCPTKSNGTRVVGEGLSLGTSARMARQNGMLMRKVRLQWMGTRMPPRMGPTAVETEPPMPQNASALERLGPSG